MITILNAHFSAATWCLSLERYLGRSRKRRSNSVNTNIPHPQTDAETIGSRRTRGGITQWALPNWGVWMSKLQEGGWWDDVCYAIKDNKYINFYHHGQIPFSKHIPVSTIISLEATQPATFITGWWWQWRYKLMATKPVRLCFASTVKERSSPLPALTLWKINFDGILPISPFSQFC